MLSSHLLYQSNHFLKLSGTFQAPPSMVSELTSKAQEVYSSVVLHFANLRSSYPFRSEELQRENQLIINEAKKHSSYEAKPYTVVVELPVNFVQWKYIYQDNKLYHLLKQWLREGFIEETIKCIFIFPTNSTKRGSYNQNTGEITLYLGHYQPKTLAQFKFILADIAQTVRHELQHYAQFLMSDLLRMRYNQPAGEYGSLAGLPKKKLRTKEYDIHGRALRNGERLSGDEEAMIDVEYHTYLQDAIDEFKDFVQDIPKKFRKELIKAWVGVPSKFSLLAKNESLIDQYTKEDQRYIRYIIHTIYKTRFPFNILQAKDHKKWEKAVSIFYSAISDLL